jgi:hypothetical protein
MRFRRVKLFFVMVGLIGAVIVSALAQTNVATTARWEVLPSWGQLPAGANWGATVTGVDHARGPDCGFPADGPLVFCL